MGNWFPRSTVHGGSFHGAELKNVDLSQTTFHDVDMTGVILHRVKGFNLDGVSGFVMDGHQIKTWRFPFIPGDAWSKLKHQYTGFSAAIHILLAAFAMAPFLYRALRSSLPIPREHMRVSILLGWDKGLFVFMSSLFLIAYNVSRVHMTYRLSKLQESEHRSGFGPKKVDYWKLWVRHDRYMKAATLASIALASCRAILWLFELP